MLSGAGATLLRAEKRKDAAKKKHKQAHDRYRSIHESHMTVREQVEELLQGRDEATMNSVKGLKSAVEFIKRAWLSNQDLDDKLGIPHRELAFDKSVGGTLSVGVLTAIGV